MTDKYLVTLVHGTFAPDAEWTLDDTESGFKKKLAKRLGENIEYERLDWGGKNSQEVRKEGARLLTKSIAGTDTPDKGRKHFIICHSHGGNVALYATDDNKLDEHITGIVCMNTPFMCALPRNFRPLLYAFFAAVLWVLGALSEQMSAIIWFTDWVWYIKLLMVLLMIPVSLLVGGGLLILIFGAFDLVDTLRKKRNKIIDELSLPNTKIPVLSIWTGGDEVSFVFSVVGGFGNLPLILLYLPVVIITVVGLMVGVSLDWLPGLDVFQFESEGWFSSIAAWTDTYIFDPLLTALAYFLVLVMSVVVITLVVNLMFCVLPYGLGLRHIPSPLWIRIFITPVPVQAMRTEFKSFDLAVFGLSHSIVYESDPVIDAIAEWMKKTGKKN